MAPHQGVLPGADLAVTARASGFELSVLLRQRPAAGFGSLRLPFNIPGASVATTAAGGLLVTGIASQALGKNQRLLVVVNYGHFPSVCSYVFAISHSDR